MSGRSARLDGSGDGCDAALRLPIAAADRPAREGRRPARHQRLWAAAAFGCALALPGACATASPPQELVEARAAYERAERGPARQHAPARLHLAKQALEAAERASREETAASDRRLRTQAYVATRRSATAEAEAAAALLEQARLEHERAARHLAKRPAAKLQGVDAEAPTPVGPRGGDADRRD